MYRHEHCLTPIKEPMLPPPHTRVHVKCFTCKKFPVCNIRADYLRTALLIENILGRPCENLELNCIHPDFKGISIPFGSDYMPEKILTKADKEGTFFALKAEDVNHYNFIYGVDKCQVMFSAEYVESITSFGTDISDEELFNLLPLDGITYPAKTETIDMIKYHYLPVGINTYLSDYNQIRKIINSVESGDFSVTLPIGFKGIFGNFNGEERYPTKEEIEQDPELILNGLTSAILIIPLQKLNNKLFLADRITFKIGPWTETGTWDSVFRTWELKFSMEESEKIFNYLNTVTNNGHFEINEGTDLFYKNIKSEISDKDKELINKALLEIREIIINQQPKTVINTTAFHADLQCKFYEWERGLNEEEGIKRLMLKYPHGIPIDDKEYYHLETIHIEPGKVPCYHPFNGTPTFMPMPYPVYIPPKCEHKPCYATRDEINEP
ncbi:MAG: hypothetical protein ACI311_02320 [Bacilli bacterium]